MTRSTDSRRARNSASFRIAPGGLASRPSRRRCFLASSRVDPQCSQNLDYAFGSRTLTTVFGGSSGEFVIGENRASAPKRHRRREVDPPVDESSSFAESSSFGSAESSSSSPSDLCRRHRQYRQRRTYVVDRAHHVDGAYGRSTRHRPPPHCPRRHHRSMRHQMRRRRRHPRLPTSWRIFLAVFFVDFLRQPSSGLLRRRFCHIGRVTSPRYPMGYPTRCPTTRRRLPRSTSWWISWRSSSSTSGRLRAGLRAGLLHEVPFHRPRPVSRPRRCGVPVELSIRLPGVVPASSLRLPAPRHWNRGEAPAPVAEAEPILSADAFVANSFVEVSILSTIGPFSFGAHLRVTDAGAVPCTSLVGAFGFRARCAA